MNNGQPPMEGQRAIPDTKQPDVRLYRAQRMMKMWEQTAYIDNQPVIRPAPMFKNIDMLYRMSVARSNNITEAHAGSTSTKLIVEDLPNPEIGYWTRGDPIPKIHNANVLSGELEDDARYHNRHIDRTADQYGRTVSK